MNCREHLIFKYISHNANDAAYRGEANCYRLESRYV